LGETWKRNERRDPGDMTSNPVTNDSGSPISVVIVDDHEVVALGLAALLQDAEGIVVAGIATTGADALGLVERVDPDAARLARRVRRSIPRTDEGVHSAPALPHGADQAGTSRSSTTSRPSAWAETTPSRTVIDA